MSVFTANGTVRHSIIPVGTASYLSVPEPVRAKPPDILGAWLLITPYVSRPRRELTGIVRQILQSTGWSNRTLAQVVGTTHPTIKTIREGHEPERRPDLAAALANTAEVVAKISQLANGDQPKLRAVLKTPGPSGETPLKLLADGLYGKAYLVAMDLLVRRRDAGRLLDTTRSRQPSMDTHALSEDPDVD